MNRSKITHVAIIFEGVTYALPAPNRHHDVIRHIHDKVNGGRRVPYDPDSQGFLDEDGRFLMRKAAFLSAKLNNQIKDESKVSPPGVLTSEDVW